MQLFGFVFTFNNKDKSQIKLCKTVDLRKDILILELTITLLKV